MSTRISLSDARRQVILEIVTSAFRVNLSMYEGRNGVMLDLRAHLASCAEVDDLGWRTLSSDPLKH